MSITTPISAERDEADRGRHRPVVSEQRHEDHAPHQGEGKGEHDDHGLGYALEVEVEQEEGYEKDGGYHEREPSLGTLHVLVLPAPL
jgi:hypothetical protein